MKRILNTLMLALGLLLMAMPVDAQILKFGVKGGVNLTQVETNLQSIKDNSTGYFVGPMMELTIPGIGVGADAAIMYAQRGKDELKMEGIEVPINLKVTIGAGSTLAIFLAAGPDFFYNLKDIDLGAISATIDGYKAKEKKAQVGLNLGGGIKLMRHLQLGLNYMIPLGDSFSFKKAKDAVGEDESFKYKTWQLSLAYMF